MASEAIGGAAKGAQAGATVGSIFGPVGTVVGGVIGGVVGLIGGLVSNKKKKQAKKFGRLAQQTVRQQQTMQLALQRRDQIRQFRAARANAANIEGNEGRTLNSGIGGAISSLESQLASNLNYFDQQVILDYTANEYRKKAGKYAGQAADIDSAIGATSDAAELASNLFGPKPKTTASTGTPRGPK